MNNTRDLTCIGCPMGCFIQVELQDGKVIKVSGNSCKRGEIYATKECTNPTRIVTSTVKVEGGKLDMVSVKTQSDIPKEKITECIELLKGVVVKAPIKIGDIIISNMADTGVNIIASKRVDVR